MQVSTLIFFTRIYFYFLLYIYLDWLYIWNLVFLIYFLFFFYIFIYLFIYLFRAAKFMHNINIIHRSFSPTALFTCLAGCLSFSLPCPAYFLCLLPVSLPCLLLCPANFLALNISLPCLFHCPAYFRALPIGLLFFMSARCTGI